MEIKVLKRDNAREAWPQVSSLVKSACDAYGNEDDLDVLGRILLNDYQAFIAVDEKPVAIAITQITQTRSGKKGTIVYCAGEGLTEWVNFIDIIADWCKAQGCNLVEGIGRTGWERILASKGFKPVASTIRKQL